MALAKLDTKYAKKIRGFRVLNSSVLTRLNVGLKFLCWQRPLLAENKRDWGYFLLVKRDLNFYSFVIAHNVYVEAVLKLNVTRGQIFYW